MLADEEVDIARYSGRDSKYNIDTVSELTISDLHANALKFMYFLVRHGILHISKDDYQEVVRIHRDSLATNYHYLYACPCRDRND